MNTTLLFGWCVALCMATGVAQAQDRIYRCGNEYTNNPDQARLKACKLIEGGNLTVVQGTRVAPAPATAPAPRTRPAGAAPETASTPGRTAPEGGGERVDSAAQRARDNDARNILETELRRAQDRLAQARQAYANGQPEKQGPEFRNHQTYLTRVEELRAAVQRAEADVESLRRELARLPGGAAPR